MTERQVSENSPELFVLQNEKLDSLAKVWGDLDARSQYLLRERFVLHKSYEEMGKALNIKPESVRMAVTRAKRAAHTLIKKRKILTE